MKKSIKILSRGQMSPWIDNALDERFDVYREGPVPLDDIIAEHHADIRAIVTRGGVRTTTAELMDRLPNLEIIANFAVGYESIDVAAAAKRGIVVTNTAGALNDELGDLTVGLLIATIRRLPQADRHARSGVWAEGKGFPLMPSLRGRSIGIAGMGRIGTVIAKRLQGFDVSIAYHSRRQRHELPYAYYADLRSMAKAVDTLIVILPGGAETRNIINADVLADLGPEGVLINVARGSVVDEAALIEALQSGRLLAAGLDVFADEPRIPQALLEMEQVVLLPHIGSATHHTRALMGQLMVQNVISWFDGKGAITPVPETPQPFVTTS